MELGRDGEGRFCLTVHSGSRSLGFQTAQWYMRLATEEGKAQGRAIPFEAAWLTGENLENYLADTSLVSAWAAANRRALGGGMSD
ncbi:RtcB family protein [Duodenibacillus massiliensis]|uniref:RtcB family protein n=1 Tax=Duodenibacillus massiliensis TaxID=1852381 RepID=UPI003AB466ED